MPMGFSMLNYEIKVQQREIENRKDRIVRMLESYLRTNKKQLRARTRRFLVPSKNGSFNTYSS